MSVLEAQSVYAWIHHRKHGEMNIILWKLNEGRTLKVACFHWIHCVSPSWASQQASSNWLHVTYILLVERAGCTYWKPDSLTFQFWKSTEPSGSEETRCNWVARVILLQSWSFFQVGTPRTLENQQHHKFGTSGTVKKMRNVRFWLS